MFQRMFRVSIKERGGRMPPCSSSSSCLRLVSVSAPPPLRSALHRPATSTGGQKDSTTTVHLETRWLGQKKWFLCPGSTLYPLNTNKLLLLLLLLGYCSGTGLVLLYRCTVCVIMYIMYSISSTLPCDRTPVLFLCFILHRSWAFKAGL